MPDATDYKAGILKEVVSQDGPDTITPIIDTLWDLCSQYGAQDIRLQALYTKRAALDIRLKEEQPSTSFTLQGDLSDQQAARFDHIKTMRDETQAEIVRFEGILRATRKPAAGVLTKTEPVDPPYPCGPNANSDRYRGSPYRRRFPW